MQTVEFIPFAITLGCLMVLLAICIWILWILSERDESEIRHTDSGETGED